MTDVVYFFSRWEPLGRIFVVGTLMYIALILFLRISGSRTLTSMNAFDFIITVAIGSVFGRSLTVRNLALAEAVAAFALLVLLQYFVAWIKSRWTAFSGLVTNPPKLLYYKGTYIHAEMRRQRVTPEELQTAVRKKRIGTMSEVEAIILESSGGFSVIRSLGDHSVFDPKLEEQRERLTDQDPPKDPEQGS